MKQGIITGCNEDYEWMLKMWWHYYEQTNTYPVTFMDFGMSKSARLFCEKRGSVVTVTLPQKIAHDETPIDPMKIREWEVAYYDPSQGRKGWFYKPFAFLHSPYDETIWVDIDSFIIKPLTFLFELETSSLALTKEFSRTVNPAKLLQNEVSYSTSIVKFKKNLPLIKTWAEKTEIEHRHFLGDQEILSRIICESEEPVTPLPPSFHAKPQTDLPPETFVVHFGNIAKRELFRKVYKP